MADGQPPPGSVQTTTLAGAGTSAGVIMVEYLVAPVWPPPLSVITVVVAGLAPVALILGHAIKARLQRAADRIDDGVINQSANGEALVAVATVTAIAAPVTSDVER